jgi:hypothetical protein
MKDDEDYLEKVVHNLTHRRFKGTSKQSVYQQGSSVTNSFYDPRNIGNYDSGQIDPQGKFATHYPVNQGSNTMGFSYGNEVDQGDDRRSFYPSTVPHNVNALMMPKKGVQGGALGSSSSGSASDYLYFNPYYAALLNPKSHSTMTEVAQPHYIPYEYNGYEEGKMEGRGTNAPSSGSAVDYRINNPYAMKSNFAGFTGGSLGAASSGSASDYYSSNPNRVPEMQSETRHYTEFMTHGGAIDWSKYLGYLKKGASKTAETLGKVAEKVPAFIEKAPKFIEKSAETLKHIKELRELIKPKQKAPVHEELEYEEEDEPEGYSRVSRPRAKVAPKVKAPVKKVRKAKKVVRLDL